MAAGHWKERFFYSSKLFLLTYSDIFLYYWQYKISKKNR